jgi:hypothetical protein
VQNTRTTLKNDERVLRGLGSGLVAQGALQSAERGREIIERMEAIDPGMVGFGLPRPDGQLILVSGIPDGNPLPDLAQQTETRDSFHKRPASGHIEIGRTCYMGPLKRWVIPVRVPISDRQGRIVAVLSAGYPVKGGSTLRAPAALPPGIQMA